MIRTSVAAVLVSLLLSASALAQGDNKKSAQNDTAAKAAPNKVPGPPSSRFRFSPTENGVLRLDGEFGQLSFCARQGDVFECKAAKDDRAVFDEEIGRLKTQLQAKTTELAELQKQIAGFAEERAAFRADQQKQAAKFAEEAAGFRTDLQQQATKFAEQAAAFRADLQRQAVWFADERTAFKAEQQKQAAEFADERAGFKADQQKQAAAFAEERTALKAEVQKQIAAFAGERAVLKSELKESAAANATLKAHVEQAGVATAAFKAEITGLQQTVNTLKDRLAATDERKGQNSEIERLQSENAKLKDDGSRLKDEIAAFQEQMAILQKRITEMQVPPATPAPSPPPKTGDLKMPSHEEIDRARAALEEAWRRVVEMIQNFQKDIMRKG